MELSELAKTPQWWGSARDRVKEVVDGPDTDIDRLISAVLQNGLVIPQHLLEMFPVLRDREVAAQVRNAIASKRIEKGRGRA